MGRGAGRRRGFCGVSGARVVTGRAVGYRVFEPGTQREARPGRRPPGGAKTARPLAHHLAGDPRVLRARRTRRAEPFSPFPCPRWISFPGGWRCRSPWAARGGWGASSRPRSCLSRNFPGPRVAGRSGRGGFANSAGPASRESGADTCSDSSESPGGRPSTAAAKAWEEGGGLSPAWRRLRFRALPLPSSVGRRLSGQWEGCVSVQN